MILGRQSNTIRFLFHISFYKFNNNKSNSNSHSHDVYIEEDYNEEAFNKEYERLKTLMGTNHFNEWFAKQKQKIDQYKENRKNKIEYLIAHYKLASEDEISTNVDAKRSLDIFEEANSIYKLQEKLDILKKYGTAFEAVHSEYCADLRPHIAGDQGVQRALLGRPGRCAGER